MRTVLVGIVALLVVTAAWIAAPAAAQDGPTAGSLLYSGLMSPRGIALGPDGMLYVAEAGEGGDEPITIGPFDFMNGHTGRISMIDPATGEQTTVADGLPSNAHPEFGTIGPADVAFLDGQLYYVQSHGGDDWGFPGEPTGIYTVNDDGSVDLFADLGAYNLANPVNDVVDGGQVDIEPGGNPYSMIVRDGAFYVSDGNQNQVMKVTSDGTISRVTELSGHPVSTGITFDPDGGPFYLAELGQEPFDAEHGRVVTLDEDSGANGVIASGFSALTDVGVGPGGQLYALQFADQAPPDFPAPLAPFTAKVLEVNSDGTLTPVVAGLNFATSMLFDGSKLYVVANGLSLIGPGEVWMIDDITDVPAIPTPEPTPEADGLPDTGTSVSTAGSSAGTTALIALLLAAAGATAAAGAWKLRGTDSK